MKKNILEMFLEKLMAFPLWIKQIIYLKLNQNLSLSLSDDFIQTEEKAIFHLYVPILSFLGKRELEERNGGFDANIYNFLKGLMENLSILEIAMNNFWSMEEVSKYYIFCLEQDFVKTPESVYIQAMAGFMSGKYRIGEYFKRVQRINVDQLEAVIIKQRQFAEAGTPRKMAEIMIEEGYITEKESLSLLVIKEESKKRFILDPNIVPGAVISDNAKADGVNNADVEEYKTKISQLTEQNAQLKDQLRKVLTVLKSKQNA